MSSTDYRTILVIEDDTKALESLRARASRSDALYRVIAAPSADAGMELVRGENPDLVVLGIADLSSTSLAKHELLRQISDQISAKIRQTPPSEGAGETPPNIRCGNLILDLLRIEVTIDHRIVPISVLEFNLLRHFIENRDRVLSRQCLLKAVWKDSVVADRTVDAHIASLRRKLQGFDHAFKTVYSAGYILKRKPVR